MRRLILLIILFGSLPAAATTVGITVLVGYERPLTLAIFPGSGPFTILGSTSPSNQLYQVQFTADWDQSTETLSNFSTDNIQPTITFPFNYSGPLNFSYDNIPGTGSVSVSGQTLFQYLLPSSSISLHLNPLGGPDYVSDPIHIDRVHFDLTSPLTASIQGGPTVTRDSIPDLFGDVVFYCEPTTDGCFAEIPAPLDVKYEIGYQDFGYPAAPPRGGTDLGVFLEVYSSPEPSTGLLLAVGLVCVSASGRRDRRDA
jgi:hypothetical protein